jgi:ABC-2 type transport system ATP-binding protein
VLKDTIEGLELQMRASSLLLTTRRAADAERLRAVAGVQSVESVEDNVWRIFHDKETTPAEAIAELVVTGGWGLLELTPERRSLEEVFIDMTQTGATGAGEDAT